MPRITKDQQALLGQIVDAYATVKEEFYYSTASGGTTIQQPSVDGESYIDYPDLEQLGVLGFISMSPQAGVAMTGSAYPTGDGIHHIDEARRLERIARADGAAQPDSSPSRITWDLVLPVLQAVVDLYGRAEAGEDVPEAQVRQRLEEQGHQSDVSRALEALERGGYLEAAGGIDQISGSVIVAPTERALQLLAGWPADGAMAVERLIGALQAQIDETADEEEKGKLKRVLDAVQGVGESVAAEVLTKVLTGV
jgi:hypothetical protein